MPKPVVNWMVLGAVQPRLLLILCIRKLGLPKTPTIWYPAFCLNGTKEPSGGIPNPLIVNGVSPDPSVPSSLSRKAWLMGFQLLGLLLSLILIAVGPSSPLAVLVGEVFHAHKEPANTLIWATPGGGGAVLLVKPASCQITLEGVPSCT